MTLQVFNPKFVERVWKARRAAIEPSKPTISDIVAEYRRNRRRCAAQQHRQRGSKPPAAKPERYQAAPDFPGRESVADIIKRVADKHSLPVEEIIGPRRFRWLIPPRHEAMVEVANVRPDLSLSQIGRAFGKDHTCVIHALKQAGIRSRPRTAMEDAA